VPQTLSRLARSIGGAIWKKFGPNSGFGDVWWKSGGCVQITGGPWPPAFPIAPPWPKACFLSWPDRSSVKLVNTIFWKRMNQFCCKSAQLVLGQGRETRNFGGQGCQRSRSQEAEVRYGGIILNPVGSRSLDSRTLHSVNVLGLLVFSNNIKNGIIDRY